MLQLFQRLILRPLRRDLTRTLLTLVSIALGVAVVIAIDLAGDAATGSFQSSMTTLLGKVDYEITNNGGVDETLFAKLATMPWNARFTPVIEQPVGVSVPGAKGAEATNFEDLLSGSTTMYGVDVIGNPDAAANAAENGGDLDPEKLEQFIVISSELADRLHLKKGNAVELQGPEKASRFEIRYVVPNQRSEWVAVDIAAAQDLLRMQGRVDRLEIFLAPQQDGAEFEKDVRAIIPEAYELQTPGARSEENRRMLRAFRWNLRILSYISLVVGAFLIYNSIAVSVVRRRGEIGILRAVGTSSRAVLAIFLGEALLLGLVGSVLGVVLGRVLAGGLLKLIAGTVNALFVTSAPGEIALSFGSIATAVVSGLGVAFLSALLPSLEASGVAPAEAMRRASRDHAAKLHVRRDLVWSVGLAALAAVLSGLGPIAGRPIAGYIATLLMIAAAAVVSPVFVTGLLRLLHVPLKKLGGAEGLLAGRSLTSSLARTSIIVTALATAIAMMVSVGIMVGSFRETVQMWIGSQLRADLYLRGAGPPSAGVYPPISSDIQGIIAATAGVDRAEAFRGFEFRYEGARATFGAGEIAIQKGLGSLQFLKGNSREVLNSLRQENTCVVSEPFSNKHHVKVGDVLQIPLGKKIAPLRVMGVYYEYSSDRGYVITDWNTLKNYLPDQPVTNVAVWLKPGFDQDQLRRVLETKLRKYPVTIAANRMLREQAVIIFDRTFAVTYALEAVAILVAMLGAANALLALVLDRRREIGLIRYLGATTQQVRKMILTEAGLIGLLSGALGLALGSALSLVLIFVINKQSFGWTIQFHPPGLLLGAALLLVWVVTILAGVYPASVAAALQPVETIHEE